MKTCSLLRFLCCCALLAWLLPTAAKANTFTLDSTSYIPNGNLVASWTRDVTETPSTKDWIGIYNPGDTPGPIGAIKWAYVSGAVQSGTLTMALPNLTVGNTYVARFFSNDGYTQISPGVSFTVIAAPTFTLDKTSYNVGDNVVATFARSAANLQFPKDWVGLYASGKSPGGTGVYASAWNYLNSSRTAPSATIQSGTVTISTTGLAAGTWVAHFLGNDGYGELATPITFTIVLLGGPTVPIWVANGFPLRYATSGTPYTGNIHGYAKDVDAGDSVTYSKVSGPDWLSIAATGVISGTPGAGDVGKGTYSVKATDLQGKNATATFTLEVFAPGTAHVDQLKVLSYNLFHGWGKVTNGARKGLDTIIQSGADVVCTVESTDNVTGSNQFQAQYIAQELGWYYVGSGDVGVASRYPITDTYPAAVATGARIRICDSPLQEAIVYSTHLDYLHYGPYAAVLDGATDASVLAEENASNSGTQATALVAAIQSQLDAADTTPVLVCGDFNCPSHQDWTAENAGNHYGRVVAWPATVALTGSGLVDTYRKIHPDPVADPGNTWSPIYTGDEPLDRIDFIFAKGAKAMPGTSDVFHTAVETTLNDYNDTSATIAGNTWPSDHAAVFTVFQLQPVDDNHNGLPDYWETLNFGSPGASAATADDDHDGISNLLEYAAGTSPLQPNVSAVVQTNMNGGTFHVSYLRRKGGVDNGMEYIMGGLHYHLMRSANLQDWVAADDWLAPDSAPVSMGADCEQMTLLVFPPSDATTQFFKLRVAPE